MEIDLSPLVSIQWFSRTFSLPISHEIKSTLPMSAESSIFRSETTMGTSFVFSIFRTGVPSIEMIWIWQFVDCTFKPFQSKMCKVFSCGRDSCAVADEMSSSNKFS
ncbi:MAG TPA: hypothetical protein VIK35_11130 [Verrucomicrobiae bacterium]